MRAMLLLLIVFAAVHVDNCFRADLRSEAVGRLATSLKHARAIDSVQVSRKGQVVKAFGKLSSEPTNSLTTNQASNEISDEFQTAPVASKFQTVPVEPGETLVLTAKSGAVEAKSGQSGNQVFFKGDKAYKVFGKTKSSAEFQKEVTNTRELGGTAAVVAIQDAWTAAWKFNLRDPQGILEISTEGLQFVFLDVHTAGPKTVAKGAKKKQGKVQVEGEGAAYQLKEVLEVLKEWEVEFGVELDNLPFE